MNYAIILSGGIGMRMNLNCPKQYIPIFNKPIIMYTLNIFEQCDLIDDIIIVAAMEWQDTISDWCKGTIQKLTNFALPGETRQGSILNGLDCCIKPGKKMKEDIVIIHDAVRPNVSQNLITQCINTALEFGGCMPVLNITDTTYCSKDGKKIDRLLNRDTLFAGQAPEAFRLFPYWDINKKVSREELNSFRGTSEIAYKYGKEYGIEVRLIPGEQENRKITTKQDLEWFQMQITPEDQHLMSGN